MLYLQANFKVDRFGFNVVTPVSGAVLEHNFKETEDGYTILGKTFTRAECTIIGCNKTSMREQSFVCPKMKQSSYQPAKYTALINSYTMTAARVKEYTTKLHVLEKEAIAEYKCVPIEVISTFLRIAEFDLVVIKLAYASKQVDAEAIKHAVNNIDRNYNHAINAINNSPKINATILKGFKW